jgi:hypothetical protein
MCRWGLRKPRRLCKACGRSAGHIGGGARSRMRQGDSPDNREMSPALRGILPGNRGGASENKSQRISIPAWPLLNLQYSGHCGGPHRRRSCAHSRATPCRSPRSFDFAGRRGPGQSHDGPAGRTRAFCPRNPRLDGFWRTGDGLECGIKFFRGGQISPGAHDPPRASRCSASVAPPVAPGRLLILLSLLPDPSGHAVG